MRDQFDGLRSAERASDIAAATRTLARIHPGTDLAILRRLAEAETDREIAKAQQEDHEDRGPAAVGIALVAVMGFVFGVAVMMALEWMRGAL